jgi:nicotinamidase-related amidase
MTHRNILDTKRAALVVIDVQEGFRQIIPEFERIAANIAIAVRGSAMLGVPVVVTEQYPRGLGHTVDVIKDALPETASIVEKTAFSSCGAGAFVERLAGVEQIVVCGLETHICVSQTAHDLVDRGLQVHVLTDCVCSRFDHAKSAGLAKMQIAGVIPATIEMAFFELMRDSKHEQFKAVQGLIK